MTLADVVHLQSVITPIDRLEGTGDHGLTVGSGEIEAQSEGVRRATGKRAGNAAGLIGKLRGSSQDAQAGCWFSTRDTVEMDTSARRATS
jgi:hypothetical protein